MIFFVIDTVLLKMFLSIALPPLVAINTTFPIEEIFNINKTTFEDDFSNDTLDSNITNNLDESEQNMESNNQYGIRMLIFLSFIWCPLCICIWCKCCKCVQEIGQYYCSSISEEEKFDYQSDNSDED